MVPAVSVREGSAWVVCAALGGVAFGRAARVVLQRFVTAEGRNTTAFFLQFDFRGLGRLEHHLAAGLTGGSGCHPLVPRSILEREHCVHSSPVTSGLSDCSRYCSSDAATRARWSG